MIYRFFWINILCLILKSDSTSFNCNITEPNESNLLESVCTIEEQVKIQSENDKVEANISSNLKIDGLIAENKEIYYLPISITNINYTVIKMLNITNSKLMKISKKVMEKFITLEYLDLSSNNLAILDENLFQQNVNLLEIVLNDNKIFLIHHSTFNGLSNLKYLNLKNNLCIDSPSDKKNTSSLITTTQICWINSTYWNSINETPNCRSKIASMIESALHFSIGAQNFQAFLAKNVKEVIRQCRNEFQNKVITGLEELLSSANSTLNKTDELGTKLDQMIDTKEKATLTSMMQNLTKEIGHLRINMTDILEKINDKVTKNFNDIKELKEKFSFLEENFTELNGNFRRELEDYKQNLVSKNDFVNRINKSDEFLSNLITKSFNSTKYMIESLDKPSERTLIIFLIILNVILITMLIISITYITYLKKSINNTNETSQEHPKYARISKNRTNTFSRTQRTSRHYNVSHPQPLYESTTLSTTENEAVYAVTADGHQNEDPIYEMHEFDYKAGQYDDNVEEYRSNFDQSNDNLTYDTSHWGYSNEQSAFVSNSNLTEDNLVNENNNEELYAEINVPPNADVTRNEQVDESQIYAVVQKSEKL